ncbi:MAG: glycine cleavage system aminomethyltransferase GcvT, partial [Holophagales bacterium]|nr:glycine cleavage system aminomethyltransferase GcvT [Holophagales bacterium]
MGKVQRTVLYGRHVESGARFGPFAGYEMPIQYEGVLAEHRA